MRAARLSVSKGSRELGHPAQQEMMPSRTSLPCLLPLTLGTVAYAQAAVEYAAKSATSALSGAGRVAHVGVCVVDSMLVPCIRQFYPVTFYVAVAAICVLLGALMYPKRRF
jgi:hypothetical protein